MEVLEKSVYLANRLFIMKTDPAEIYKEYIIEFGGVGSRRSKETKFTTEYNEQVKQIDNDFNLLI